MEGVNATRVNERGRLVDEAVPSGDRTYCMLMHLSQLVTIFTLVPVVVPLIMWQIKKDDSAFIDDHGREAVNFQISLVILSIAIGLVGLAVRLRA